MPMHPEFGRIYAEQACTVPTPFEEFAGFVGKKLHISLGQDRFNGPFAALRMGPSLLRWSARAEQMGYFYMEHLSAPFWEFAPLQRKQLADVHVQDLNTHFCAVDDPEGESLFGRNKNGVKWSGRTVIVQDGDIILARVNTNRSTVYVIQVSEQKRLNSKETIRIQYAIATNVAADK